MTLHFVYPVVLKKDRKDGGYVVTFPNLPEAITQGDTIEQALHEALDCLEEAIVNRIAMKLPIPKPSKSKKYKRHVILHATLAAKAALYMAMQDEHLSNVALAKKLNCDEKEVRRLMDPHYLSKFPRIEAILEKLGKRLEIGVASA